jgi:hypothetical protein
MYHYEIPMSEVSSIGNANLTKLIYLSSTAYFGVWHKKHYRATFRRYHWFVPSNLSLSRMNFFITWNFNVKPGVECVVRRLVSCIEWVV